MQVDQILTWAANGTMQLPSEEVLVSLEVLTDMLRQCDYTLIKTLLERCQREIQIPQKSDLAKVKL